MTASTMSAPEFSNTVGIGAATPASLRPKEHGAYAILGIPLFTALAISGVNPVTLLVSIAAVMGFLANEPLLVVMGRRGARAQRSTPNALRTLLLRLTVAVVCGAFAFWLGGREVRVGLFACLALAAVQFVLSSVGQGRTMAAQLTGIAGLTLPGAVVFAGGGSGVDATLRYWLIWLVGHTATTLAVRATIAKNKTSGSGVPRINDLLMIAVLVTFACGIYFGGKGWIVIVPLIIAALGLRLRPSHPIHLKRVGWGLVSVNVFCGLWMIWLFTT